MHLPRLVVAGAHSGAGKTTFSLALMAALTRRGHKVQPYKVGPDYIDPAFHQAATGRVSRNLDSWLLPPETLLRLFCRQAPAEGLSVIEGVMGLFDGQGTGSTGSTAHVASLLKAPVVLLINGEGLSLSAAALVSGYANFRPHPDLDPGIDPGIGEARVAAVLINRVSGPAHYAILRQCIEEFTGIPCLGWMPKNAFPPLPSRHLGLIPAGETPGLAEYLDILAAAAEKTLDIPALAELARSAPPLSPIKEEPPAPGPCFSAVAHAPGLPPCSAPPAGRVRIGVARDEAFSFYYQDNLDLLEELGARLVPFSPLRDKHLPDSLDGLYLGGGFPEIFAPELEANRELRSRLAAALESGLPAYAECGGMLYLCSTLAIPARDGVLGALKAAPARDGACTPGTAPARHAMVGFFPEQAEMTARLQPFGYITATLRRDTPLGPAGTRFRAHEFHYSRLLASDPAALVVLDAEKPDGRAWAGGLCKKNVLAMFPHLHFHSCPQAAANFVETCARYRNKKDGGA